MANCKRPSAVIALLFMLDFVIHTGSLNINDQCSTDADCPTSSTCKQNSCGFDVCLCDTGYVKKSDSTACLQLKRAGESCSASTQCVLFSSCVSGLCECTEPSSQLPDGRCNDQYNGGLHGESCTSDVCSPQIAGLACDSSVCVCDTPTYRDADSYELSIQPEEPCYLAGSSIEDCSIYTTASPEETTAGFSRSRLHVHLSLFVLIENVVLLKASLTPFEFL